MSQAVVSSIDTILKHVETIEFSFFEKMSSSEKVFVSRFAWYISTCLAD